MAQQMMLFAAMPPGVFTPSGKDFPETVQVQRISQLEGVHDNGNRTGGRRQPARNNGCRGAGKGRQQPKEDAPDVNPLYKTRLCNFYMEGACQKGSRCSFAHGHDDLRDSPDFSRTSVCPALLNIGECRKPDCRYAHNAAELRVASGLLKTKMCSFHLSGLCIVGEACRFAHTAEELQEALEVQRTCAAAQFPKDPSQSRLQHPSLRDVRRIAFAANQSMQVDSGGTVRAYFNGSGAAQHNRAATEDEPTQGRLRSRLVNTPFEKAVIKEDVQVRPAQVVSGRVRIDLDDIEEPLPLMVAENPNLVDVAVNQQTAGRRRDEEDTVEEAGQQLALMDQLSIKPAGPVVEQAGPVVDQASRTPKPELCRQRVVVDIEDVGAIEAFVSKMPDDMTCSLCQTQLPEIQYELEGASSQLVEVRRRGKTDMAAVRQRSPGHCVLAKTAAAPCSISGRFPECAMCPRGGGQASGTTEHPRCAACERGVRIVARNTFLTVDEGNDQFEDGSCRRRSHSE